MKLDLEQIKFCAESCEMQRVLPIGVYHMLRAFGLAQHQHLLTYSFIIDLGRLIEPIQNEHGIRIRHVHFGLKNLHVSPPTAQAEDITRRLQDLIMAWHDDRIDAIEFYKEFELIHPFMDGNGRVGAILLNFITGTLEHPSHPPDIFGKEFVV